MLTILSPTKGLNFRDITVSDNATTPIFDKKALLIVDELKKLSFEHIQKVMKVNPQIAANVIDMYKMWNNDAVKKEAIFAYSGEAFRGLNPQSFSVEDLDYAQKNLRILSGLYGVVRPLDLIKPYRLEMQAKLQVGESKNLYQFWGETINKQIIKDLGGDKNLVNLASKEYCKSILPKNINANIITPIFKDFSKGKLKTIIVYAKKARGSMAQFIIKNRIENIEEIKAFDTDGYSFDANLSDEGNYVFIR